MNAHVDSVCDKGQVRNPPNLYSTAYLFNYGEYISGRRMSLQLLSYVDRRIWPLPLQKKKKVPEGLSLRLYNKIYL